MFNLFDFSSSDDYQYLLSIMGQDVLINGESRRVLITNTTIPSSSIDRLHDDRRISSLEELKRGDIIEWEGKTFMIVSEESSKRYTKWKGIMRRLPFELIFNHNCFFIHTPAYIEANSFSIDSDQFLRIPVGQIVVSVPDNEQTAKISLDDRFLKLGQVFRVTGIDRYSREGIIDITCEKDLLAGNDDVDNEIAGLKSGSSCSIAITNTEPLTVSVGQTIQITYSAVGNPPVVFLSSDENIAIVDENGLVTGVSAGTATITVANATNPLFFASINIEINEVIEKSISINSNASNPIEIFNGQSKNYIAHVFENEVEVFNQSVIWEIFADDQVSSTNLATIAPNGNNVVVTATEENRTGFVQLKATLESDDSVFAWFRIRVRSLI